MALAAGLTVLWIWSRWCSFPSNPWNDIRVAPAIALHQGISVYAPPGQGSASTWAYGPLPLFVLAPAGFAPNAAGALEAAGAIHIIVRVLCLLAICLAWPTRRAPVGDRMDMQLRLAAALFCVLWVRNDNSDYGIFTADSIGLSVGGLGLLALVRGHRWLAAFGAVGAVACKQTMIGVGLAQVIWLWFSCGPKEALRHTGRGAAAALLVALAFTARFGATGLWHVIFEMPGRYPWASFGNRIAYHSTYFGIHVVAPLVAMAVWKRSFFRKDSPLLLPALAFLCTLPFSLAGFLKIGGNVNNLHSFWLWFPMTLAVASHAARIRAASPAVRLAFVALPALVACVWLQVTPLRMRPNVAHYHEAAELTRQRPGQIWFPMNPIVTLYGDGRLYHDFDGLRAWAGTGFRATDPVYFAGLPPQWNGMATLLPIGWLASADDARLPPGTRIATFGHWQLDLLPEGKAPPAESR